MGKNEKIERLEQTIQELETKQGGVDGSEDEKAQEIIKLQEKITELEGERDQGNEDQTGKIKEKDQQILELQEKITELEGQRDQGNEDQTGKIKEKDQQILELQTQIQELERQK